MATNLTAWGNPKGALADMKERAEAKSAAASAQAKFIVQYGKTPLQFVLESSRAERSPLVDKRSPTGKSWMNNSQPTTSKTPAVVAYHNAEDEAKALSQEGRLEEARVKMDEAILLREAHDQSFGGADKNHEKATRILHARRNSMGQLLNSRAGKSAVGDYKQKEAEAREEVNRFFMTKGAPPPL